MRIAFYAPLKPPDHPTPSGDRRMARLLMQSLTDLGHDVALASRFRSHARAPDAGLRAAGQAEAARLVAAYESRPHAERPALWFTYHLYYKAPDWLGPTLAKRLAIPYVVAEPSHAPKRATGEWREFHADAEQALRAADAALCLTLHDQVCVRPLVRSPDRLFYLPPFLDPAPFVDAQTRRPAARRALTEAHAVDPDRTWLLAVGMMRQRAKLASYRELAAALTHLAARTDWSLIIVGDGEARADVEAAFAGPLAARTHFIGALEPQALGEAYAAADIMVWPAVDEAYGMALLEASAAGLPVIAGRIGGVPDIVRENETGLLAPPHDTERFAAHVAALLDMPTRRFALGRAAAAFVAAERSSATAARILSQALVTASRR